MRVLLVVPPTGKMIREDRCQTPIDDLKTVSLRPPLELMCAAGGFEQGGAECRIVDYPAEERGWDGLREDLKSWTPDVLVISITCPSLAEDLKAAVVAKEIQPTILTLAKGALFEARDLAPISACGALDGVLRGECEHTCREVAEGKPLNEILGLSWRDHARGNGSSPMKHNADRLFEDDLDALPFPARHLIRNDLYTRPDTGALQTTLIANRGCPHTCIYCLAQQVAGAKHRRRSPQNIAAEIRECIEKHGIRSFLFRSDLFTASKKWTLALCKELVDSGLAAQIDWACNSRVDTIDLEMAQAMKRAGCFMVAFGVESGDDAVLERLQKRANADQAREALRVTRAAGLKASAYFLIGLPWETKQTVNDLIDFACELDPDVAEFFYVYPFPGTELHRLAVAEGLLREDELPVEAYGQPAMAAAALTREELKRERMRALRRHYLRPRYILRTLAGARSPKVFANYMRFGFSQLGAMLRSR